MFELFEHKADIGVRGIGETKEGAFAECAKALFEIMCDTKKVIPSQKTEIIVSSNKLDELLVEFLNELLYLKDTERMLFSKFEIKIKKVGKKFGLEGIAFGEKIDAKRHELKTEAKAASYSQLLVEKNKNGKWTAQCIVDV
ncbi:MAG: archease [Candidatus Diapherotrites archaeon]|nr:archease [Candidatus Diapherotrites archaeon]